MKNSKAKEPVRAPHARDYVEPDYPYKFIKEKY
jgi:hypothetical protein